MPAIRNCNLRCRSRRPAAPGFAASTRRRKRSSRIPSRADRPMPWLRAAQPCWSAETLGAALIDRMARLAGIGDAYHDYRGELRHFSLETKTGILRAMGCAVDDPTALAAELSRSEIERWRTLLPPMAAANGKRIGVDLNIGARDFGASLQWAVNLEHGERRTG